MVVATHAYFTNIQLRKGSRVKRIVMKYLLITVLFVTLYSCGESELDEYDAKVEVEYYVKDKLTSPATADFNGARAKKIGDLEYKVSGSVDAQNGFGAVLTSRYSCKIKFSDKKGSRYTITEFVMN